MLSYFIHKLWWSLLLCGKSNGVREINTKDFTNLSKTGYANTHFLQNNTVYKFVISKKI